MSTIFVSHASSDDARVDEVSAWLNSNNFKQHFVDHKHITGGEAWDKELRMRASKSDVFILFVTPAWLISDECYAEYRSAFYSNKPVVPLFVDIDPATLSEKQTQRFNTLCASVQGIKLSSVLPEGIEEQLLSGALSSAVTRVVGIKRWRILKWMILITVLVIALLIGLAVNYQDYVFREYQKWRISSSFSLVGSEALKTLAAKSYPSNDRTFLECESRDVCPMMIIIPAGTFVMGEDDFDDDWEMPEKPIQIRSIAVSVHEITQSQWRTCSTFTQLADGTRCKELPTSSQNKRLPVSSVSWVDAQSYVTFLNRQIAESEEGPYRLLSEAEWEYAARGETDRNARRALYHWGDDPANSCKYANMRNAKMPDYYQATWEGFECPNNSVEVSMVGTYEPNKFGLYDVAGNVTEWVEDCWHNSYHQRPLDNRAWNSPDPHNCDKVLRGGSWYGETDNLRSAARKKLARTRYGFNIGFRVARDLDWTAQP